jgi:hypothetical protein
VWEERGDDAAGPSLKRPHTLDLRRELGLKVRRQVHHPALVVLGGARIEPDGPGLQVELAELDGEHLALAAPPEGELDCATWGSTGKCRRTTP